MKNPDSAAEHLRTIRSLMERSTIYRAISGAAAVVGGTLALVVGGILLSKENVFEPNNLQFALLWFVVLGVTSLVNLGLLWRGARQRQEAFVSAGMKHALAALAPPLLAGCAVSLIFVTTAEDPGFGVKARMTAAWTLFYGLALLATGSFAPRSMKILGAAFFLFGTALFLPAMQTDIVTDYALGLKIMIGCFGILHLLYGAWVVLSSRRNSVPASL